jgi:hypothetical protein
LLQKGGKPALPALGGAETASTVDMLHMFSYSGVKMANND